MMCRGCYAKYGSPRVDNAKVQQAAAAISDLYDVHLAGGSMHIVTDDWNLDDQSVAFCGKYMTENRPRACEVKVFELFTKMTIDERASALAKVRSYDRN